MTTLIGADNNHLRYTRKQQMDRYVHELEGVLRGITVDGQIGADEIGALNSWLDVLGPLMSRPPFAEIATVVQRVVADGVVDAEELADLNWMLERWTTPNVYFDAVTADIQRLHGMIAGILADGVVTDTEIAALADWLDDREHLRTTWPYDEISAILTHVRRDRVITDDEKELVRMFLADLVPTDDHHVVSIESIDLGTLNVRGICAVNPDINFSGQKVCFTGASAKAERAEIFSIIEERGGLPVNHVSRDLAYLVVGGKGSACWAFSCYGRKIEAAMQLRRHHGAKLLIIHEVDFWDAVAD
jgi:hypothetical protein